MPPDLLEPARSKQGHTKRRRKPLLIGVGGAVILVVAVWKKDSISALMSRLASDWGYNTG